MTKRRKPYFPRCCNTAMKVKTVISREHHFTISKCKKCGRKMRGDVY